MPFDDSTRSRLQTFVGAARDLLVEEFSWQLQQTYGMDPVSGEVAALDRLGDPDDQRLETARILREIMQHYLGALANPSAQDRHLVLDRIVREQAFTVLNRLAALRLMEARGILLESVARGYQSTAFQLYQRVAGSALGETGDAYRVFLFRYSTCSRTICRHCSTVTRHSAACSHADRHSCVCSICSMLQT